MALVGGAAEPGFGLRQVHGHAAPQLIGLRQIELGIGIARDGERPPLRHGGGIFAALPRIDARFDVGVGGEGG